MAEVKFGLAGDANLLHRKSFFQIIIKYFKMWYLNVLYTIMSLAIGCLFFYHSENKSQLLIAVVFFLFFMGCQLGAKIFERHIVLKYVLAGSAFIIFLIFTKVGNMQYVQFRLVAYNFPILYAYLFSDLLFVNAVGVTIAYFFSRYSDELSTPENFGNIVGMLVTSLLFSIISFLVRRLTEERDQFRKLSTMDSLTGVATLSYTMNIGQKMLDSGSNVSALLIDLDRFKDINDTYGHFIGNKVLIQVANFLQQNLKGINGLVGRLGGDEFVILLKDFPGSELTKFTGKLYKNICSKLLEADPELPPINLSYTIGKAHCSSRAYTKIEELIHAADMDMYYNKFSSYELNANLMLDKSILSDECCQLLSSLAEKDMYTYVHSQYVAQYAQAIANELKLPRNVCNELYIAGWLHDIGKIMISNKILRKPTRLTDGELKVVKNHVSNGLMMINPLCLSDTVNIAIRYHHERWDGLGYPDGIEGNATPIEGRILQVADVFSAITIRRLYREKLTLEEAIREIKKCSGAQFDPQIANVFTNVLKDGKVLSKRDKS